MGRVAFHSTVCLTVLQESLARSQRGRKAVGHEHLAAEWRQNWQIHR